MIKKTFSRSYKPVKKKSSHVGSFSASSRLSSRSSASRNGMGGKLKFIKRERIERILWSSVGFLSVGAMFVVIIFLFYLQRLTVDLPSVENPFKRPVSSIIYDKNNVELYKVSAADSEIDLLSKDEYVPEVLKWSFLAAEDEEFYNHGGFDATAILRCAINNATSDRTCGGSTITQQVIKNTVLVNKSRTITKKIEELILAMQLERLYEKDEIMNIYFNIVPQGSRVSGIKTGANFYFGKKVKDLKMSEMMVLSAVVQNPTILSPTVGSDLDANKSRLHGRTDYIVDQMIQNIDRINQRIKIANEQSKDKKGFVEQKVVSKEELEKVKAEVRNLKYQKPVVQIKAPHFVFYVKKLLQERGYNNGKPFSATEIEAGGLKIETTLDYGLQEIAEEYVSSSEPGHAGKYRNDFNAKNSALITMKPATGEILTMVGSKCYSNNKYIDNCKELDESEGGLFDSDVNIMDTLQSPGSTNKALGYYAAFNEGLVSPGSYVPDVPIEIGTYRPKNYDGSFTKSGFLDVRRAFAESKNIPPLFLIEKYGVQKYLDTAREFGYTTYTNPNGYGPSVVIGGTEVKGIEHAQGFSVFANGGDLVQHEVIHKITNIEGKVIYEHKPERKRVADPAAVYMVNNVLNPKHSGSSSPVKNFKPTDKRDVAGKTGTSENNRDTWFAMWSPEFVTIGWMGNNDNTRMLGGAFGSTSVEPWVSEYMTRIASDFPATEFNRPSGIVSASSSCGSDNPEEKCELNKTDIAISGKVPPPYLLKKSVEVCIDQPDRKAREIDIQTGFSTTQTFTYLKSPAPKLQVFIDKFVQNNGGPTEECDIERTSEPDKPDGIIISPQPSQAYNSQIKIEARGFVGNGKSVKSLQFFIDNEEIARVNGDSYNDSVSIKQFKKGLHTFEMVVTDNKNKKGSRSVDIYIGETSTSDSLSLGGATEVKFGESIQISSQYSGNRDVKSVTLYQTSASTGITTRVGNMTEESKGKYSISWRAPGTGKYSLYAVGKIGDSSNVTSNDHSVQVNSILVVEEEAPQVGD